MRTATQFAQDNCQVLRESFAKHGITMPEFDDKTAALAVTVFAVIGKDDAMIKAGRAAMKAMEGVSHATHKR